jgi:hypothetical protein
VVSQLLLIAYTIELGGAHNLFCTNEEIKEACATNANYKQKVANWLNFDNAHDLNFFTYLKFPIQD